jgi:hypothetical protein
MKDVIQLDIIPYLLHKIMQHNLHSSPTSTKNAPVDTSLSERLDSLPDIAIGIDSVQKDKIECLTINVECMEDQLREQIMDLKTTS